MVLPRHAGPRPLEPVHVLYYVAMERPVQWVLCFEYGLSPLKLMLKFGGSGVVTFKGDPSDQGTDAFFNGNFLSLGTGSVTVRPGC